MVLFVLADNQPHRNPSPSFVFLLWRKGMFTEISKPFLIHPWLSLMCTYPDCSVLAVVGGGFNHSSVFKVFTVLHSELSHLWDSTMILGLGVVLSSVTHLWDSQLCYTPMKFNNNVGVIRGSYWITIFNSALLFSTNFSHPLMLWISLPGSSDQKYEFSKNLSLYPLLWYHTVVCK